MITKKAHNQFIQMVFDGKIPKNYIEAITLIMTSNNKLIKEFTKKGEIILEDLKIV